VGARPLQQREVAATGSALAGPRVPWRGRALGAGPLQQVEVAAESSGAARLLVPWRGRALGARPLQQLETASFGRSRGHPRRPLTHGEVHVTPLEDLGSVV